MVIILDTKIQDVRVGRFKVVFHRVVTDTDVVLVRGATSGVTFAEHVLGRELGAIIDWICDVTNKNLRAIAVAIVAADIHTEVCVSDITSVGVELIVSCRTIIVGLGYGAFVLIATEALCAVVLVLHAWHLCAPHVEVQGNIDSETRCRGLLILVALC